MDNTTILYAMAEYTTSSDREAQGWRNFSFSCPLPHVRVPTLLSMWVVVWTICVCGVVGNAFTLLVLRRYGVMTSYTFLLRVLAVADASFLVSIFAVRLVSWERIYNVLNYTYCGRDRGVTIKVTAVLNCLLAIAQGTSNWTLVVLAFNRYFAVCRPFSRVNLKSLPIARTASLAVFLVFVIVETTFNIVHSYHPTLVGEIITRALRNVCPFVMLICLNRKLLVAISAKRTVVGSRSNHRDTLNIQMTRNLIGVLILFFVCIPTTDFLFIMKLFSFSERIQMRQTITAVADIVVIINYSVNFIIYCIFTEQFRETVKSMFPCFERRLKFKGGLKIGQRKDNTRTAITSV